MYRNVSGVRFTISFLALLLVVFLSACSSQPEVTYHTAPIPPSPAVVMTPAPVAAPTVPQKTPVAAKTATSPKAMGGTYSESVSYQTPEGQEDVAFVFTVQNGVLQNVTLNSNPNARQSAKYQARFMDGIVSQVVGKKVSEIGSFDRVNGSSLTAGAFNEAVAKLKAQS